MAKGILLPLLGSRELDQNGGQKDSPSLTEGVEEHWGLERVSSLLKSRRFGRADDWANRGIGFGGTHLVHRRLAPGSHVLPELVSEGNQEKEDEEGGEGDHEVEEEPEPLAGHGLGLGAEQEHKGDVSGRVHGQKKLRLDHFQAEIGGGRVTGIQVAVKAAFVGVCVRERIVEPARPNDHIPGDEHLVKFVEIRQCPQGDEVTAAAAEVGIRVGAERV